MSALKNGVPPKTADDGGYTEVTPSNKAEILPGYVGNLTKEQEQALVEMWQAYFTICAKATGTISKTNANQTDFGDDAVISEKASKQASKVKDEKAADEVKAKEKQAVEQAKMNELLKTYGKDALHDAYWAFVKTDNPDTNMLRFLRARKWDVPKAIAMMAACLKWRLDTNVQLLSERGDLGNSAEIDKFITQQASGKIYAGGCNAQEQPICFVRMKMHNLFAQSQICMKTFIITQMETWRSLFVPPNDKIVILFDCTSFGLKALDIPSLLYVLACLESYFPESLSTLYLHNAPWIVQKAWVGVKNILDPVVRAKVRFTNGTKDLLEQIPSERLPVFLGGQMKNEFEWVTPNEGENDLQKQSEEKEKRKSAHLQLTNEFEQITAQWCADPSNTSTVEKRRVLVKRLRVSALELEPYTRGLTAYDRNGNLCNSNRGIVVWDYEAKDSDKKIRQVVGHRHCLKTLKRELKEIDAGANVADVEAKTTQMLDDGSWGRWDALDDPNVIKL